MHEFCDFQDIGEPLSRLRRSKVLHHGDQHHISYDITAWPS